jgi:hypothetical protein
MAANLVDRFGLWIWSIVTEVFKYRAARNGVSYTPTPLSPLFHAPASWSVSKQFLALFVYVTVCIAVIAVVASVVDP